MIPCEQAEEITKIKMNVERLVKVIEGNGQKGLQEIVTITNQSVINMTDAIKCINLTLNELMLYKSETEGFYKAKSENKKNKAIDNTFKVSLIAIIISLVIFIFTK